MALGLSPCGAVHYYRGCGLLLKLVAIFGTYIDQNKINPLLFHDFSHYQLILLLNTENVK